MRDTFIKVGVLAKLRGRLEERVLEAQAKFSFNTDWLRPPLLSM